MSTYRLTHKASEDLERIYAFGVQTFGRQQADRYADRLLQILQEVAQHPHRWPEVTGVSQPYRQRVHEAHSIFFRVCDKDVLIVRILGREDVEEALSS